jgi:DNA-dependent protein kinase catalytic subunit
MESMKSIIFDELMNSIIKIIEKLDFAYDMPTMLPSMPDAIMVPQNPKDFAFFLNLVEFCKSLFPRVEANCFNRWIYLFSKHIIAKSTQYPLISGFYKLLTIAMKKCEEGDFFQPQLYAVPKTMEVFLL